MEPCTLDTIYVKLWQENVSLYLLQLERQDQMDLKTVKSYQDLQIAVETLRASAGERLRGGGARGFLMLFPAMSQIENFTRSWCKRMSSSIDISALWGLIYLVIKVRSFERVCISSF